MIPDPRTVATWVLLAPQIALLLLMAAALIARALG